MSKNEGNQKLKFFKPSDLAWNAPYKSQCFKEFYDYIGPWVGQSLFISNGIKEGYEEL